jgi:hypothetical protein
MNSIYIALNPDKQIDCNKLCESIQVLIQKQLAAGNSELVLCITTQNITNSDSNLIPKITQQNS